MTDDRKTIRIFIGSPGDVESERKVAYRVIAEIGDIFQLFKEHGIDIPLPSLRAIGSEQVASDAGLPNSVILERFPIENSHIFIFILWKRFGSAPGTRKSTGGKYDSGTQEEFERAYQARLENKSRLPSIMVYKKTDEFSLQGLSAKEINQYKKVANFFERCGPRGRHPAFVRDFTGNDFESLLRKNLLDTILQLIFKRSTQTERTDSREKSLLQTTDHPSLSKWLKYHNLSANPFRYDSAEDENEKDLARYYVPFKDYPINESSLLQESRNWLLFGQEGSGKTALKKLILSQSAPIRPSSKILAMEYEPSELRTTLTAPGSVNEIILRMARQIIESIENISSKEKTSICDLPEASSIFARLEKTLYQKEGYERILCLLDVPQPDEPKYVQKYLESLAGLAALPTDKTGFRLFLPRDLKRNFLRQEKYLGKCDSLDIKWENKELKELIKQRLIYYSINKANPCQALAVLCEPRGKMRSIDDEIIAFAQGRPRAVIWLSNRLLLEHCQNDPILPQISIQSWEKTLSKWIDDARRRIIGVSGTQKGFSTSGEEVFFGNSDKPLKLTKSSKMLLKTLIEADGQICSKERLAHSAWTASNSDGVSKKAIRQAIQRLRNELKTNNIDPKWIDAPYGQGYQLIEPENALTVGRDVKDSIVIAGNNNKIINLRTSKRSGKEDR